MFAVASHRRGFERFLAVFTAVAMLMSLMVIFAQPALAHHPETSASSLCDTDTGDTTLTLTSTAWTLSTSERGNHDSVKIQASTDNSTWHDVTTGAYAEPSRSFSVTISGSDAIAGTTVEALEGTTLYVRSEVQDVLGGSGVGWYMWSPVGDSSGTKNYGTAASGNENSANQTSIQIPECEPDDEPVTVTPHLGACVAGLNGPQGEVWFTIDPASGATVEVYDHPAFLSGDKKGGPLGNGETLSLPPGNYWWNATAAEGYEFDGPSSGGPLTIDPCDASVTVDDNICVPGESGPAGGVEITIDPQSGATVTVVGPGGPYEFTGTGGTEDLPPGDYTWTATAAEGFELTGDTSGEFTIDPCEASVVVAHGDCVVDGQAVPGFVTVSIDPTSGATVEVTGPGGPYAFTGAGGTEDLAPGDYSWTATATDGFELTGVTSGQFTVDPCGAQVIVTHGDCEVDGQIVPGFVNITIDPASGATVEVTGPGGPYNFTGDGGTQALAPGSYSWTATAAAGFELTGNTSGEFNIVDCAGIIIEKRVLAGSTGEEFVFNSPDIGAATGGQATVSLSDDEGPFVVAVPAGTYDITEIVSAAQLSAGWFWLSLSCNETGTANSTTSGPTATAVVEAGEAVHCIWTNNFIPPEVEALIVVDVTGECVLDGDDGVGVLDVKISIDGGATVVITEGGTTIATLTESALVEVPEGKTYVWTATAGPDNVLAVGSEGGTIVVETCSTPEVLPFTGIDSGVLVVASLVMLGSGLTLIHLARRREEG